MRFGQFQKAIIIGNIPTIGSHCGRDHCTPIFSHIFVWGSCFFVSVSCPLSSSSSSRPPPPPPPPPPHNFVTQTTLSHTISHCHTQLCHTPSLVTHTHNFVTYNFVTHNFVLCHTPFFNVTRNFVTSLSHTALSHTTLSHTTLSHTIFHTHKFVTHNCHTQVCHTPAWQACPPSFCKRGTYDTGLDLVARLGAVSRPWRRGTLRGRRGTCSQLRSAWQAWHLWHWAGSGGALGRRCGILCGRRGTWWHPLAFDVAGVALAQIDFRFAWQAWHLCLMPKRPVHICAVWCECQCCFFDFLAAFFKLWHKLCCTHLASLFIIVLLVSTFALRPGALYNFCVIMAPITKLAPMDVLALTQRGQKCLHGAFHHCESQFDCVHTCFAARSLSAHLIEPMRASSVCPC